MEEPAAADREVKEDRAADVGDVADEIKIKKVQKNNMKQSNTIILVIVVVVGLLAILTIGLYVRNTWQKNGSS